MISDLSNFISSVVAYNVSIRHQQVLKEKRNYIYMIDINMSFLSKGSTENFKNCTVKSKKPHLCTHVLFWCWTSISLSEVQEERQQLLKCLPSFLTYIWQNCQTAKSKDEFSIFSPYYCSKNIHWSSLPIWLWPRPDKPCLTMKMNKTPITWLIHSFSSSWD